MKTPLILLAVGCFFASHTFASDRLEEGMCPHQFPATLQKVAVTPWVRIKMAESAPRSPRRPASAPTEVRHLFKLEKGQWLSGMVRLENSDGTTSQLAVVTISGAENQAGQIMVVNTATQSLEQSLTVPFAQMGRPKIHGERILVPYANGGGLVAIRQFCLSCLVGEGGNDSDRGDLVTGMQSATKLIYLRDFHLMAGGRTMLFIDHEAIRTVYLPTGHAQAPYLYRVFMPYTRPTENPQVFDKPLTSELSVDGVLEFSNGFRFSVDVVGERI